MNKINALLKISLFSHFIKTFSELYNFFFINAVLFFSVLVCLFGSVFFFRIIFIVFVFCFMIKILVLNQIHFNSNWKPWPGNKVETPSSQFWWCKTQYCISGVATGGSRGARCPPRQWKISQKLRKRGKKSGKWGKIGKKREKIRKRRKNWEGSFTLPLLTDRAGYATRYCTTPVHLCSRPMHSWRMVVPRHGISFISHTSFIAGACG